MLSTLNKISNSHNNCEDSYAVWFQGSDGSTPKIILGALSDGCSTGTNTHFASQLLCKLANPDLTRHPFLSDFHLLELYFKLQNKQKELKLDNKDLWATLILFKYDVQDKKLSIRCFGDGVYYVNGKEYVIDQDDKVHYLVDQKDIITYAEFCQHVIFTNVENFRVCTDGIKQISLPNLKASNIEDAKAFLLTKNESQNHLERKYNIIRKQNWINIDDLTIVAYDSI